MGFYINPPSGTKEDWLQEHGELLLDLKWPPDPGKRHVCLVSNLGFTAAGIAFDEEEFNQFSDIRDTRVKEWYLVSVGDLLKICPEVGEKLCLTG